METSLSISSLDVYHQGRLLLVHHSLERWTCFTSNRGLCFVHFNGKKAFLCKYNLAILIVGRIL